MTRSATIAASIILGLSSAFAQSTVDVDLVDISFTNPSWFVLTAGAAAIVLDHTNPIVAGGIAGASVGSAIEYFLDDGATLSAQITDITRLGATIAGFSASIASDHSMSIRRRSSGENCENQRAFARMSSPARSWLMLGTVMAQILVDR